MSSTPRRVGIIGYGKLGRFLVHGLDADPALDFVCRDWQAGDAPSVLSILPDGYQVACHLRVGGTGRP